MAEKYTRWCDKSNGVNPFVPEEPKLSGSLAEKLIGACCGVIRLFMVLGWLTIGSLVLFIIREPFAIMLGATAAYYTHKTDNTSFMVSVVITVVITISMIFRLPYISFIRHQLAKCCYFAIVLLSSGMRATAKNANSARVVGVREKLDTPLLPGQLVICNLTNMLEIFIIGYEHNCAFLFPVRIASADPQLASHDNTYLFKQTHIGGALYTCLTEMTGEPVTVDKAKSMGLKPLSACLSSAKSSNMIAVLFVEGIRTNGTGILEFPQEMFVDLTPSDPVHLLTVSYPTTRPPFLSPASPVGSQLWRIFCLASTLRTREVDVLFLNEAYVPKIKVHKASGVADVKGWVAELRNVYSKLANKKTVSLGAESYRDFCAYYTAVKSGNLQEAKKIADSRSLATSQTHPERKREG